MPEKYLKNYIPYALKLAVWCDKKGVLSVTESLLFEITSLYKNCAEKAGKNLTELDISTDFSIEIDYAYK